MAGCKEDTRFKYDKTTVIDNWFLQLSTTEEITTIYHHYLKYGIQLNLADLIEMVTKEPLIKSALKVALDFWDLVGKSALTSINPKDLENSIQDFSSALAIVSAFSSSCKLPILKQLADFSLIYMLHFIANHETIAHKLLYTVSMISITTEEPLFDELSLSLQNISIATDQSIIFTALYQAGIDLGSAAVATLEQQLNCEISLLQIFCILSMRLQDLNITISGVGNKEVATVWQELTEQFITLQLHAERQQARLAKSHNVVHEQPDLVDQAVEEQAIPIDPEPAVSTSDPIFRAQTVVVTLNEHNHWQAAQELEDLLVDLKRLDRNYEELTQSNTQQPTLPKLLLNHTTVNIPITNNFPILEFKLIKTTATRIKIIINSSNSSAAYSTWYTEIHLAACPRSLVIPGFNGELLVTKAGDLVIQELPKNLNYNFISTINLQIKNLKINGRLQAKVYGTIFNNNISVASGGIWLLAKHIDNTRGIFTTFNVPDQKMHKLGKYLSKYRLLTKLLTKSSNNSLMLSKQLFVINAWFKKYNLDLKLGKIYIQATNDFNNNHGSILSGNFCKLYSNKLNGRYGTIASHTSKVNILTVGDDGEIICCENSTIWAATVLQATASKIIKDDTSSMGGLVDTILRSYNGNIRYEGVIFGININLTQDRGFYYQYTGVNTQKFTIITSVTSNVLEKPLQVNRLQIDVTDPNSYIAQATHDVLGAKQIKLRLPAIDLLHKMRARDTVEIYTPSYQLAEEQNTSLYTINLYNKISANKVVLAGHGVKQLVTLQENSKDLVIETQNLLVTTCNLQLPAGFKVTDDALLHVTGAAYYDPEKCKAGKWLGLYLPSVKDFSFANTIAGSLYAKVLTDNPVIDLPQDLQVGKHIVVSAPNSVFGAKENPANSSVAPIKLHTGKDGKILLIAKGFNLTKASLYGDRSITLLATAPIECGLNLLNDAVEPYIHTNGALVMATANNQEVILRHATVTAMQDCLLQGQTIKHIGVNLHVGAHGGALTYIGQPVVELLKEKVTEPKDPTILLRDNADDNYNWYYHYKTRYYINWDKLKSRRSAVNVGGKLTINAPQGFIGSSFINLKHGAYTGVAHAPILTELSSSVQYISEGRSGNHEHSSRGANYHTVSHDANYVYETLPFEYNTHGLNRITITSPLTINYNFVGETVEVDLGNNKLTVGRNLTNVAPIQSNITLIKLVEYADKRSYIQLVPNKNNIFTRQPIFPINFCRPQLKIVILITSTDYIIADPADYPLDHAFIEMQGLMTTINYQLGHQQIDSTGLSDKEIYYHMLANAIEHANSKNLFLEQAVIKPMLVYSKLPNGKLAQVSMLPKILNIPALRANVGGIFARLLKVSGTAESAIDLLGAIVAKEGYKIDVGYLAMLQQYRTNSKIIRTESRRGGLFRRTKTSTTSKVVEEKTAIENTGLLETIRGNGEINLSAFTTRGGSIVCLHGNTIIRVRELVDLAGLVNVNYDYHSSRAKTTFETRSDYQFVKRQQIVPFKLMNPNGTFTILCDNKIHAAAIQTFANAGYMYGKNLLELKPAKLWQELGPVHVKRGMMLSTTHGSIQTAAPCTFILQENMIFETGATGVYQDTGSQVIAGKSVTVKSGSVEVKPIALQSKSYTRSSGLLGFAVIQSNVTENHKVHQSSSYTVIDGSAVFHALSKDITACSVKLNAAKGKIKFITDHGKVKVLQATDEHSIVTNTHSIGISCTMSDTIMHAMRGEFSQAMQASIKELNIVRDINNLLHAEGGADQGVKGVTAANVMVKSLLSLQEGGFMGFLAGGLSSHAELNFGKEHKTVNFGEIVGNWLLAKEIIISAQEEVSLTAINGETQDLHITSNTGSISVDGGTANSSSSCKSTGVSVGVAASMVGGYVMPTASSTRSSQSSTGTTHDMSRFKVTGNAYLNAIKGDITFRNAVLEARKAYVEAIHLKLESQRDETLAKASSSTIGTSLKFSKSNSNFKWVREQTGIRVSDNLHMAIAESSALIGSYIEVGAAATPLKATTQNGSTEDLYELLLPKDCGIGFKVLGIPRAQAISQLFSKSSDPEFRAMLAPEIIQQLKNGNLVDSIKPNVSMTSEELLTWANTKECYENYLGFYLALESTPLMLNKHSNIGAMFAIAKLNNLNLRIWDKAINNELHGMVNYNKDGKNVVNIAIDVDGNYTRLSKTPGMLISPIFNYSDVVSSEVSHERGLTMDGLMFGDLVGRIKKRDVAKEQINFAHLSGNIQVQSNNNSKMPNSNVHQSDIKEKKRTIEVDTSIVKKVGELAEGLSRLKEVLRQYNPDVQKAMQEAKKALEQQKKEEALRQANAATKEASKVPEILKEQLTDQQVRDGELLQTKQAELLDRLKQQLNLRALQEANQNGTVINVPIELAKIEHSIMSMDREQINQIGKALDLVEGSRNSGSEYKITPVVLPLTPAVINALTTALGAGITACLAWQATKETKATLEKHEQEKGSRTEFPMHDQQKSHHTEFPINEQKGTTTETPNVDLEKNVFAGADPESVPEFKVGGFPVEKQDWKGLFFSKRPEVNKTKDSTVQPEAAKNREENIAKGIPGSVLGPSGKPKIIEPQHSNKKRAKDSATSDGQRGQAPEHHPNPVEGDPHFHPSGSSSRTHHSYPKRDPKYHPPKKRD